MNKICISKKVNISNVILFLLVLTSSMIVFEIKGKGLFLFLSVAYVLAAIFYLKRFKLINDKSVYFMFTIYLLSMISCFCSSLPYSYKYAAFRATIIMFLVFIVVNVVNYHFFIEKNAMQIVRKALKLMCAIQILWSLCSFAAFKLWGLDINQVIFVDVLKLVESASQYKGGVLQPSGLSWHSSTLAPVLALSYFLFNRIEMKLLSIVVAVICGNATALIGMVLCIFIDVTYTIIKKREINKRLVQALICIGMLVIIALLFSGYYKEIYDKVMYILHRMSGNSNDSSAYAHIRYYWSYPQVLDISNPMQIIFGYGKGCSGYPIGVLFEQYTYLGNWSVESDIMDILISEGIFGFIAFYYFLLRIIRKGKKIDVRYSFVVIVWILEGVTYNIQFEWFIFMEVLILLLINNKYNIFDTDKCLNNSEK